MANRLSTQLRSAGIFIGETMHTFMSGCSITLSLLGIPPEDIARHVGWSSVAKAEYYSQMGKPRSQPLTQTDGIRLAPY